MIKKIAKLILPNKLVEIFSFNKNLYKRRIIYSKTEKGIVNHYKRVESDIKQRKDKKLKVLSYVVFDSTFGGYGLMELMLTHKDLYQPKIVIIPDVSRGMRHQIEQYEKTKKFFSDKYGSEYVADGYDIEQDRYIDYSESADIIYFANPYDTMVNEVHTVKYMLTKNVLPIYIGYCTMPDLYSCKEIIARDELSLFWKVFADNKISLKDYKKYQLCRGRNVVLTGYAKMDSLASFNRCDSIKKRIIIAPHHSIDYKEFPLSNFLEYKDFILELPKIYPNVDFIFRPHPILFTNMINKGYWTEEQSKDYIRQLQDLGVIYSTGGDYLDIFVNSDAIIHDCSSFIVEYLYTGKPCCFVGNKYFKTIFSSLGKSCLKNYYLAFNKNQILGFIDSVIIAGQDTKKEKRERYASKYLAINYPNVSQKILEEISL